MIFNWYNYSPTTRMHQHKIWNFLRHRGYNFICIEAPDGLQNLQSAANHYEDMIKDLKEKIAKKGSRRANNIERKIEIKEHEQKLDFIKKLIYNDAFDWQVEELLTDDTEQNKCTG